MHVRVCVGVTSESMDGQRISAYPASEVGTEKPLSEVLQPNFDVLLFACKPVILPEAIPATGPVVTVGPPVGRVRPALDELACVPVNDQAGRSKMVGHL